MTRLPLIAVLLLSGALARGEEPVNRWVEIDREDADGGKAFARAIHAENVGRVYLWGTGGRKPARNVYARYELESFDFEEPGWRPAFPKSKSDAWTAHAYPPFRILGQSGPDGLKHDEGPRLKVVGGYHATNRIQWWDFDGTRRPSPVLTFNMACWDSKRSRVLYYTDGRVIALDPRTNEWTDLETPNHPTACENVAWASMAYDSKHDRVMLIGGGLALNPAGAAPTWFYDCTANTWSRTKLEAEPPPRCNAALEFDSTTGTFVLFGGYDQSAALSDTWVFDANTNRWEERRPKVSPPPMFQPAAAMLPGGKLLVVGNDARKVRRDHAASTSARKETWIYDVAGNTWSPLDATLELNGHRWLTATPTNENTVVLVAFGPDRRTLALRYDPEAVEPPELPGAAPGTLAWKYPIQKSSLEDAPAGDSDAHAKTLADLPSNRFVNANPSGTLVSKTWSTAVLDSDRSEVLYVGGGHSGYSGNDVARYSIAENRWTQDFPPRFPPYLEGTNAGIYGWSYGRMPFSQHTYLWYDYDPSSKTMLYLARPSIQDGDEVQATDDPASTFVYDSKQHGYASWVYDSAGKRMHPPSFGRTFTNRWHLATCGTPLGVFVAVNRELHHAKVDQTTGEVTWGLVDSDFPQPPSEIRYHYEFQPLVHDTKRNRLVQLKGDDDRVDVYARPLTRGAVWSHVKTTGTARIGREAVYIAKHDTILWLREKLYALDCRTYAMRQLDVDCPKGVYGHECAMVYDAKHDVCVALIPSSFSGPMQTFLFRYEPDARR